MALAFSPDGALLASASLYEHHARLWDLKTQRVRRVFAGHARSLNSVAFSPDGSLLATAGNDGMVGLWTVATGQRRASLDGQATCPPNRGILPGRSNPLSIDRQRRRSPIVGPRRTPRSLAWAGRGTELESHFVIASE